MNQIIKTWGIVVAGICIFLWPHEVYSAKKEVPMKINGVINLTEKEAVEMISFCLENNASRRCIFVDPRKKKDLKRGIIRGSVLYECKDEADFDAVQFLLALNKKGYSFQGFDQMQGIDIISGCNGKYCPRSHGFLSAVMKYVGPNAIQQQDIKLYWIRQEGIPGMLRIMK
ncbi:MAG: hypothetical protein HQM14_15920 [SAR324 cluster bacterium]|nr:hypothetical protein [SAR324 cluster bacterium]